MTDDNTQPQEKPKPGPKPKADPAPEVKLEAAVIKAPEQQPEPDLGRMVRYVTSVGTIRPALITAVNEDGSVDLTVFNSQGAVPATLVRYEDAEVELEHTYHWPTY